MEAGGYQNELAIFNGLKYKSIVLNALHDFHTKLTNLQKFFWSCIFVTNLDYLDFVCVI